MTEVAKPRYDAAKFKEMLLYVAAKEASDDSFGAIKLNKILFYSDFLAYALLGRPISGAAYQHLQWGPAARALLPVQRALVESGEAKVVERSYYGYPQSRLVPQRQPNLNAFTPEEIMLIDRIVAAFRTADAITLSNRSHEDAIGWQLTKEGEVIPYPTVFVSTRPVPPAAFDLGREIAARRGVA